MNTDKRGLKTKALSAFIGGLKWFFINLGTRAS